jgi:excisionase family DNA binding protein
MGDSRESIRALATVTLDARALEELGSETIDRLADLVAARLAKRRAAGEEPLLTAAAAAELVGVHPETMRRAIRLGEVELVGYVGSRPRVRRGAVEAWVARGLPAVPVSTASRSTGPRGRRDSYPWVLGAALEGIGERAV